MKVLLSYTSYPLGQKDWRGRFMLDLAHALADQSGLDLRLWGPPGPVPPHATYVASATEADWLRSLLEAGGIAHLLRNYPIRGLVASLRLLQMLRRTHQQDPNIDIAHIAWLQNALALFGTRTPALVSVLGSDFKLLGLPGMVPLLRAVLRQRRCVLAPNGKWMVPALRKHFSDVADIRYVPLGIDSRWFRIQRHPVPTEPRCWLVVLRVTAKKIGSLFDWGADLFGNNDELHLFGPMQENVPIPPWVHYHGPTNPDALARKWYPQATGMISLSTHDEGRPQVLLEAMAAGLPVLVSPIPAHCDLVTDGENGRLIGSADALRAALVDLKNSRSNLALGERGRAWIRDNIGTWEDCAKRYAALYQELCEQSHEDA